MLVLNVAVTVPATAQLPPLGPGDIIEPVRAESGANNDHPVTLDPGRVYEALARLEVKLDPAGLFRTREPRRAPIFTEEQLEQLVPHLVEAFAELDPRRDLGVSVSQARRINEPGFLSGSRTTSARVFHRDGEVHLIFGQVEKDVSLDRDRPGRPVPNAPASVGLDRGIGLHYAIGTRKRPNRLDWEPILPEGARIVDSARNDWIAVRPDAFEPVANARARETADKSSPAPDGGTSTPATESPRTSNSEQPRKKGDTAPSEVPSAVQGAAPAEDPLERKLRMLKRYRDQGLIEEDLYREKVRELIDGALETEG